MKDEMIMYEVMNFTGVWRLKYESMGVPKNGGWEDGVCMDEYSGIEEERREHLRMEYESME